MGSRVGRRCSPVRERYHPGIRVQQRAIGDGDPGKEYKQGTDEIPISISEGHEESGVEDGLEVNGVKAWECLSQRAEGLLSQSLGMGRGGQL